MGFFDERENVLQYIEMCEGIDDSFNREKVEEISTFLSKGASLLELGMGPGFDMELLGTFFNVTGSDRSQVFLDLYHDKNPKADLLKLDAVTLETDRRFDCIFSNKVLHHLDREDLKNSFQRQHHVLNPNGLAVHTFWTGTSSEDIEGLLFNYYTEEMLKEYYGGMFTLVKEFRYKEMEDVDSLFLILRRIG